MDDWRIVRLERELDEIQKEVLKLQISKALLEGKADQKSVYVAYLLSLIGLIISLIGIWV